MLSPAFYRRPGLEVARIEISNSELARVASDHLPLVAKIRFPGGPGDKR